MRGNNNRFVTAICEQVQQNLSAVITAYDHGQESTLRTNISNAVSILSEVNNDYLPLYLLCTTVFQSYFLVEQQNVIRKSVMHNTSPEQLASFVWNALTKCFEFLQTRSVRIQSRFRRQQQ